MEHEIQNRNILKNKSFLNTLTKSIYIFVFLSL